MLNVIAHPQYDPNMKPVDLPVVSGPNTRYRRNFKTTRKGMQIVFVGLYVAEHPTQGVEIHAVKIATIPSSKRQTRYVGSGG